MSLRKPDSRQLTFAYEDQYQLFQVYNITCSAGTVCIRKPNLVVTHDNVTEWKHFPRYWPFARGIHRSPVNSPHKGQWRDIWWFFFICALINGWVNCGETGDLRRHRAHYDVIVMRWLSAGTVTRCGPMTPYGDIYTAPSHYVNQCWLITKAFTREQLHKTCLWTQSVCVF